MSFAEWLRQPKPAWEENLELAEDELFQEIGLSKEELKKVLEQCEEFKIFDQKKPLS